MSKQSVQQVQKARFIADQIVTAITKDMLDRSGLQQALEACDDEVRDEISSAWMKLTEDILYRNIPWSKQSEAKLRQRYVEDAKTCGCCRYFFSSIEFETRDDLDYWKRTFHCTLGNFDVKQSGSCAEWIGNGVS